jgi:hypothetical protein
MIYPATYDITILQNSTWKAALRATQERVVIEDVTVSGGSALFMGDCHGLEADDAVVITAAAEATVPCGLSLNSIYYVLASGLTNDQFYASATISGAPVSINGAGSGIFYAAKPVNLSGYTIDADLTGILDNAQVATFVCSGVDLTTGLIQMSMGPSVSSGIEPGRYNYDLSLTVPNGERYYWLTGIATVQRTYSRN